MTTPLPLEVYDKIVAAWRAGDRDDAVVRMTDLAEQFPEEPLPNAALAAWHKKLERIDDAIRYAEKYTALKADDSFGFSILSSLYIAVGLHDEAEEALMKARDLRIAAQLQARQAGESG